MFWQKDLLSKWLVGRELRSKMKNKLRGKGLTVLEILVFPAPKIAAFRLRSGQAGGPALIPVIINYGQRLFRCRTVEHLHDIRSEEQSRSDAARLRLSGSNAAIPGGLR